MKKADSRGFTLLELLVVVSIISLLVAIVLSATSSSRAKAKDSRVISDVQQIRVSLHYGFLNTIYRDLYNASANQVSVAGTLTNAATGPSNANLTALAADLTTQGSTVTYIVNTTSIAGNATTPNTSDFAVYGRLVTDSTKYFCMDSAGRTNGSASAATTVACP